MKNEQKTPDLNAISSQNNPESLSAILKNLPDSFFFLNPDLCYISFNDAHAADMKALYGVDIEIGASILDTIKIYEDWSAISQLLIKVLEGESVTRSELWGNIELCQKYFDATYKPVYNSENYITGIIAYLRDTTEQKLADIINQANEERLKLLFDNAPLGYQSLDINGCLIDVNQQWLDTFGYQRKEIIGKRLSEFVCPESREALKENFRIFKEKGSTYYELEFLHKKGHRILVAVQGKISYDIHGEFKQTQCIVKDITENKRVADELKERDVQYRNLANSGMALIWRAGTDKLCNYFNEPWLKFTGRTLEQEMGNGWADGVHPDDFDRCLDTYVTAFDKREVFRMEYRLRHVSGEYRWLMDMGTPNYDSNEVFIGYIGHCFDIHDQKTIENNLYIEQSKLDAAFENPSIGFVICNGQGGDLRMNETALRFHDFASMADMLKKVEDYENDWVLHYPDGSLMKYDEWPLVRATRGEFVLDLEIHYINSKTHRKWICNLTSSAVRNSSNEILFIVQTLLDITDRKHAENSLKESEEKFRNIFENSVVGKSITSMDGKMLANKAFCDMVGYSERELNQLNWQEITHPDDIESKQYEINQILTGAKFSAKFQSRYIQKNGDIVWVDISAVLQRDNNGDPLYFITSINDVTGKKLADEKVERSEKRFRALVENVQDMVLIFNAEGKIIYTSPAVERITGFTLEDIQQMTHPEFIHPDELESRNKLKQVCSNSPGVPIHNESRLLHKDGHTIWVEGTVTNLLEYDSVAGIVTNYRDITDRKNAEEKLYENNDLLIKLMAQVPGVVYQYRLYPDGHSAFPYSSSGMYDIYEVTSDEVRTDASAVFTRLHPDDFDMIAETINESARSQTYYHSEFRVILPEQGLRWRRCEAKPELLEDGSTLWHGIISDITDWKKAEEILQESEDRYRSLFQRNSSVMLMLNPDTGNVVDANPAACSYYGWTYSEICKKNISDINILSKDEVQGVLTKTKNEQQSHLFLKHRLANGDIRDVEVYATPIKYGVSVMLYAIIHDITDSKKAERQLRESEEKLSTLFSSMTEMVAIHELVFNDKNEAVNYRIIDCNRAFTDITGISKDNAIGKLATEVYQTDNPPYLEEYSRVGITGESFEFDSFYAPLDKYFKISVVSPRENHFATITSDITTIKQFENEVISKNKELENYLYIASHDLRSPLVNIQGFSQRLNKHFNQIQSALSEANLSASIQSQIEQVTNEAVPKTVNFILSNVTKMDNLINSLLQISRTGRLALSVKKIDMNKLFSTIIATHNYQITELSAEVVLHNLADCYGDENQLNQLFSNILDNAIKYRDSSRQLEIGIKSVVQGKKLIYSISDNGRGINSRHLEKIWDIFFRIDPAASEMGEGIGLSIAKTIANKHKGKVWVESEEGKGSTFFIELQQKDFSE